MNVHELIDRFVICVAQSDCLFESIKDAPWIAQLEHKLPKRLPASFRSLVTRYSFATFEAGRLSFYANMGTDDINEMSVAIFRDHLIADATLKAGYIQFARPATGSYDPICFDARRSANNREFPLVRLDHEEILCHERVYVSERVADSFYGFAADIVRRA
jgi:hypothetical protein